MQIATAREQAVRLCDLFRNERHAAAEFLLALAEFDGKRLWADLGHSGLFSFLHRELGMSKGAAYYRKVAAELIRSYPEILDPLREGLLCITALPDVAKVLTAENRREVLPRFFHCSRREAQEISAILAPDPAPPVRDVMTAAMRPLARRVEGPAPRTPVSNAGPTLESAAVSAGDESGSRPMARAAGAGSDLPVPAIEAASTMTNASSPGSAFGSPQPSRGHRYQRGSHHADIVALTADLRRLHITVSKRFVEKLEAARAVLSHAHPSGRVADILEAALDVVLARDARRKRVITPRSSSRTAHRRKRGGKHTTTRARASRDGGVGRSGERTPSKSHRPAIPAAVRRAVWERDQGRCQYPLATGGICGATMRLQIDHVEPVARGGQSTLENTRLVCQPHNLEAARAAFGSAFMARFTTRRHGRAPPA